MRELTHLPGSGVDGVQLIGVVSRRIENRGERGTVGRPCQGLDSVVTGRGCLQFCRRAIVDFERVVVAVMVMTAPERLTMRCIASIEKRCGGGAAITA